MGSSTWFGLGLTSAPLLGSLKAFFNPMEQSSSPNSSGLLRIKETAGGIKWS